MRQVLLSLLLCLCACFWAAGCESPQPVPPSPTQLAALETRELDGQRDDILRAAAAVILDKGYFYLVSDHEAGILTAARVPFQAQGAFQRSGGMRGPVAADIVCLWVRQTAPQSVEVRLQAHLGGHRVVDEKLATAFWTAVQRRMLGGEAAPPLIPPDAPNTPAAALPAPASRGGT